MLHPNFIIFYVDDPAASRALYADLLGCEPVDASPTFVMFALDTGLKLGLWSRDTVEPSAATTADGSSEIAFPVASDAEVDAVHADWQARGLKILQTPTATDFGRTFLALDPDGHRLRVYAPTRA
jgi:catechol 2,3-dioxygenase-like lactoylglutathione lyase family enzyme